MRKIIFHLSAGFAGYDSTENGTYPDDVTEDELNEDAWMRAVQHAETYGHYLEEYLEDCSEVELAELTQSGEIYNYTHNIEGYWEDYDPEEHDMLVPGGGKWEWA